MAKQDISLKGKFNFKNLNIDFERKKVKYLRLKIDRTLNFKLTIPLHYEDKDVVKFLEKNEIWIKNKQKEILSKKTLLNDNEVYFLGKKYHLIFDENYHKTCIKKDKIFTKNQQEYKNFQKQSAKIIFNFFINKWQFVFDRKVQKISIKEMVSRWGSCNHKKAYINLNLKLIQKPIKSIEYVILHELTHLIYPHHQKEFYTFLYKFMPDYTAREIFLKSLIF